MELKPGDKVKVQPEYGKPFTGEYCRSYNNGEIHVIMLEDGGPAVKVDAETVSLVKEFITIN